MAHFIGKKVVVTLKTGRKVEGLVGQVLTDSAAPQLVLNNVCFTDSGHKFPLWNVSGNDIADLAFAEESIPVSAPPIPPKPHQISSLPVADQHLDPAIVSYAKPQQTPPLQNISSKIPPVQPSRQAYSAVLAGEAVRPQPESKTQRSDTVTKSDVHDAARLKAPFSSLDTLHPMSELSYAKQATSRNKDSRKRRGEASTLPLQPQYQILQRETKPKLDVAMINLPQGDENMTASVKVRTVAPTDAAGNSPRRSRKVKGRSLQVQDDNQSQNSSYKGKGWRQSPMLKEANAQEDLEIRAGFRPSKNKKQPRSRRARGDDLTGWATEDATDIQELGEFDFEANLANFDKASVFAQLRREDEIPEAERLVSHNKLKPRARPGTFGGTKLHPTENVLDYPSPVVLSTSRRGSARRDIRSMPSDSSSAEDDEAANGNKVASGRAKQKRFPNRTSTINSLKPERSNTDPVLSNRLESSIQSLKRPSNPTSSTSNGQFHRLTPSESEGPGHDQRTDISGAVNFYTNANIACPVITPGGMTALEDLARSEHRHKPHLINENAGRTLAEIIVEDILAENGGLSQVPTAIYFIGNHRAGARALVTARHLMSRGFLPVCCVLGLDRPGAQLDVEADRQINILRHTPGAVVANWREVQKYLSANEGKGLFADVWVDALVAPGHSYDTLVPEDQTAVREMVAWANRRPASGVARSIYSIDVPCGINASTGEVTITEKNTRIQLRSSNIVCMGAPRTGLLIALRNAYTALKADTANGRQSLAQVEALLHGSVHVVDIGVNEVWKQYGQHLGLATGSGVDFGLKWYITLTLDAPGGGDETWETD